MNSQFKDSFHEIIKPVTSDSERPLWSILIPTYNCATYLKETLSSVLSQFPGEDMMEIIVVDDNSLLDNPEAVVKKYGKGYVQFIRQTKNVGKSRNYATALQASKGKIIHILHGDDTVNAGFYDKMAALLEYSAKTMAAFCRCNYINEKNEVQGQTKEIACKDGPLTDFINEIATWQIIQPPSIVFKREVYEQLGGYDNRLKYIEDWEFYVRVAMFYDYAYTPEILANYRTFPENSSNKSIKGGKRISTVKKVIQIINEYLPSEIQSKIDKDRNACAAIYILNHVPILVKTRDLKGLVVVTSAFAGFNKSIKLWGRWLRFIFQAKKYA